MKQSRKKQVMVKCGAWALLAAFAVLVTGCASTQKAFRENPGGNRTNDEFSSGY